MGKRWILGMLCAALITVIGCSGDATDKAAGEIQENAKKVEADAGQMVETMKSEFGSRFASFEEKLGGIKTAAASLQNEELNSYVATIETKLGEAKTTLASLSPQNLTEMKSTLARKVSELTGMFKAAEDKIEKLKGGVEETVGG